MRQGKLLAGASASDRLKQSLRNRSRGKISRDFTWQHGSLAKLNMIEPTREREDLIYEFVPVAESVDGSDPLVTNHGPLPQILWPDVPLPQNDTQVSCILGSFLEDILSEHFTLLFGAIKEYGGRGYQQGSTATTQL